MTYHIHTKCLSRNINWKQNTNLCLKHQTTSGWHVDEDIKVQTVFNDYNPSVLQDRDSYMQHIVPEMVQPRITNLVENDILSLLSQILYKKKIPFQFVKMSYFLNLTTYMSCNIALTVRNILCSTENFKFFEKKKLSSHQRYGALKFRHTRSLTGITSKSATPHVRRIFSPTQHESENYFHFGLKHSFCGLAHENSFPNWCTHRYRKL